MIAPGSLAIGVSRKLQSEELDAGIDGSSENRWWTLDIPLDDGDVIGVAFGQSDLPNLSFTRNGKPLMMHDVKKIGGTVYPVISVGAGACVKIVFESEEFTHPPPTSRFSPLMVAQSVL